VAASPPAAPSAAAGTGETAAAANWFASPPGSGEHGLPEAGPPEPGPVEAGVPEWTAVADAGATTGNHDVTPEAEGWVPADWAPTERSQRVPRNAARTMGTTGQAVGEDPLLAVDPAATGGQAADPTRPAEIEVRVLGRVEVGGVGRIERGKSEELIVFLALNPEGVDSDRIADALWRGVPPAKATLNTTTTVARNSLGTTEDGSMRLPHARNGVYRLDPSVGLDWARFQALVARAESRGPAGADDLRAALDLVRGRPFEGVRPRTYGWALLDLAAVMESAVVDAADRLAELRLQALDAPGAQWAARCGLKISPYDERLYRRLMLAADLAGNPAGVEAVMEELLKRLDDDSFEPWDALHDETRKLYERLIGARQGGQQNRRRA
jgi:DNA-binding SARP family transcriptional activator